MKYPELNISLITRSAGQLVAIPGCVLLCLLAAACSSSGKEAEVDAVFQDFDRADGPGLAVGVQQGGKNLYVNAFGMANLEHRAPVSNDTIFHVASVSKQFTAFAIALLAADGELEMDEDIRTYLPYVPDFGETITVRDLVTHVSGIRDQWGLFQLGGQAMQNWLRQGQVINLVKRQEALNFAPGTHHMYSNTGYTLLAEIVSQVSGQSFREFCEERIFAPLGMDQSFFFDDLSEIVPNRADSYRAVTGADGNAPAWKRDPLNYENVGATSLFSTASDLLTWTRNFSSPRVGSESLLREFLSMAQLADGTAINYGYGLTEIAYAGHRSIGHSGKDAGFVSLLAYFPENDFSVVLIANTPVDLADRMNKVVEIYLGRVEPDEAFRTPDVVQPDSELVDSLVGSYVSRYGGMASIAKTESGMEWQEGQRRDAIVFRADGSFDREDRRWWSWYTPLSYENGKVMTFSETNYRGGRQVFERAEQWQPAIEQLEAFAGEYYSAELDVTYRYEVSGNGLQASALWLPEPVQLLPTSVDRFDSTANVLGTVQFQRDAAGRVASLLVHDGRIRKIRFTRNRPQENAVNASADGG